MVDGKRQPARLFAFSVLVLLLAGCTRGSGPASPPAPGTPTSTPQSAETPTTTRWVATPSPSSSDLTAVAPSSTRTAEPSPSVTTAPTAMISVSPTPTVVGYSTYVISDVVLFDGAHGRLYAQGRVDEEARTLVLSATDGDLLAAYDYAGALGLDAEHRWLYVDAAGAELVILHADTGVRLGAVELPSQEGSSPLAIPPQADPAQGQVLAFRRNVVYVADAASGRIVQTVPFEFEKSQDCRIDEGPYPIEWAAYDASKRILYVSYLSYVCTPWFGFTIISYDMASGREIARSGEYAFQATVANGYLYGSSWHRFGIGYIWAWRDGEPSRRSSDWNTRPYFAVDQARQRLYGDIGGTLGVFDAQSAGLLFALPWPAEGQLAGFDSVADRLYFLLDGRLRLLEASQIKEPASQNLTATAAPTTSVDALVVSPDWLTERAVVGIWGKTQPMDRCYAFAQQGGILLLSSDAGSSWAEPGAGLPACQYVSCLALSPGFAQDQTLLVGLVGLGVFRSTDGGRLWRPASVGLGSMNVQELLLSPGFAADHTAFARVGTGGPYRSTDGGQNWQEMTFSAESHVEQLLLSPGFARDLTVFARLSSGELYRSRDAGATWLDLGMALRPLALSSEFDRDGIVLGAAPDGTDLYISRDGGTEWERLGNTPAMVPMQWLSVAPLFAKWGVAFAQGLGSDLLYRTSDGGLTWREVSLGSGESLSIAADASVQMLYAPDMEENRPVYLLAVEEDWASIPPAKRGQLFRSGDGGITWRWAQLPPEVVPTSVTLSPQFAADGFVLVGTADGRVLTVRDDTLS